MLEPREKPPLEFKIEPVPEYKRTVDKKIKAKFFNRAWAFLDGKKFWIGTTIAGIGQVVVETNPLIGNILRVGGGLIASGGAAHKVVKGVKIGTTAGSKAKEVLKQFNPKTIGSHKMDFTLLLPLLIEGAKTLIDTFVDGAKLNETQQKIIKSAYNEALIWGVDGVASTATTLDDAGLAAFLTLCEDTANEGGFSLLVTD